MCQNLLAFFKDSCPFSIASIVASSPSNAHLPHCVKLGTLFIFIGFLLVLELLVECFPYWCFVGLASYFVSYEV
jgi:hypothetical protein